MTAPGSAGALEEVDVGDGLSAASARWNFAGDISRNFDAHVERSIPGYHEGHQLILSLSDFFLGDGSVCYELGCSTGSLTRLLAERHQDRDISVVALDIEADMVEVARGRCADMKNAEVLLGDVVEHELGRPVDFAVAYYTVQFVAPKLRQEVITSVYSGLNWGGGFAMFEKVRAPDARFQDIMTQIYWDYKLANGYSPSEIVSKARSLKGVLEPFSTQGNIDLLRRAGFTDIMTVMKSVSFEGFLAIK